MVVNNDCSIASLLRIPCAGHLAAARHVLVSAIDLYTQHHIKPRGLSCNLKKRKRFS